MEPMVYGRAQNRILPMAPGQRARFLQMRNGAGARSPMKIYIFHAMENESGMVHGSVEALPFFVQVHRFFVDGAMWGNWLRCYKAIETGVMAF